MVRIAALVYEDDPSCKTLPERFSMLMDGPVKSNSRAAVAAAGGKIAPTKQSSADDFGGPGGEPVALAMRSAAMTSTLPAIITEPFSRALISTGPSAAGNSVSLSPLKDGRPVAWNPS